MWLFLAIEGVLLVNCDASASYFLLITYINHLIQQKNVHRNRSAGWDFPQEPGNQVPRKFFHWQEILDEIPRFSKEILVQIHAHLKGTMSSDIIFCSSHSLFDIFAKFLLLMKKILFYYGFKKSHKLGTLTQVRLNLGHP